MHERSVPASGAHRRVLRHGEWRDDLRRCDRSGVPRAQRRVPRQWQCVPRWHVPSSSGHRGVLRPQLCGDNQLRGDERSRLR